jgi:hypothetical protein
MSRSPWRAVLGLSFTLLAGGAVGSCASGPPQSAEDRPVWPPGIYVGSTYPLAVYVFADPPPAGVAPEAELALAHVVVGSAASDLPTQDIAFLVPRSEQDEIAIANPTIRLLRLLAYARARSPAPIWLIGTKPDLISLMRGRPPLRPQAFAGFVLLPSSPEECNRPAVERDNGLFGMPTVEVGTGSPFCQGPVQAEPDTGPPAPPAPITAPYQPPPPRPLPPSLLTPAPPPPDTSAPDTAGSAPPPAAIPFSKAPSGGVLHLTPAPKPPVESAPLGPAAPAPAPPLAAPPPPPPAPPPGTAPGGTITT